MQDGDHRKSSKRKDSEPHRELALGVLFQGVAKVNIDGGNVLPTHVSRLVIWMEKAEEDEEKDEALQKRWIR